MGPRLGSWGLTPIGKYSKTGGAREERSPVQIKHRDYIFLILEIKDLPNYICMERLLQDQKGSNVNLPTSIFARIHLGYKMHAHGRILR